MIKALFGVKLNNKKQPRAQRLLTVAQQFRMQCELEGCGLRTNFRGAALQRTV